MDKQLLKDTIRKFIPLAATVTLLCGLLYGAIQQVYRQNANDPQVQIVRDISAVLESGAPPEAIGGQNQTDIQKSLASFITIYNSSGSAVVSTAMLDGKTPELPKGTLDEVKKNNETRFTWEPKKGVREAAVIRKYDGKGKGFVLVGRSLSEIESRINRLGKMILVGYLVTILGSFIAVYFSNLLFSEEKTKKIVRKSSKKRS